MSCSDKLTCRITRQRKQNDMYEMWIKGDLLRTKAIKQIISYIQITSERIKKTMLFFLSANGSQNKIFVERMIRTGYLRQKFPWNRHCHPLHKRFLSSELNVSMQWFGEVIIIKTSWHQGNLPVEEQWQLWIKRSLGYSSMLSRMWKTCTVNPVISVAP